MLIKIPKGWEIPEREVTPESVDLDRRKFLVRVSAAALSGVGSMLVPLAAPVEKVRPQPGAEVPLKAPRNPEFKVDCPITSEPVATGYNNYYEFSEAKDRVWKLAQRFESRPWQVEIKGLVQNPRKVDVDDLMKQMTLEERVYRHRCVEAWSMVIPWVGFPLRKLVEWCEPKARARFLRLLSFLRPSVAEGQRQTASTPWPYHEALTLEEATNDLAMVVVGMYGKVLPNQNGSPIRLITPWKYGYKSIKGITRFEFVEKRPDTFWNTAVPFEYHLWGNALPWKPHPRWSQATERVVETGERIPSLPYNGYEKYVAQLYKS